MFLLFDLLLFGERRGGRSFEIGRPRSRGGRTLDVDRQGVGVLEN